MARAGRKRRFSVFSLSFLDVMSCGFGAVVLIFLVINHRIDADTSHVDRELLSESRLLDFQIQRGEEDLVDLREELADARRRVADARRQLLAKVADSERRKEEADELEQSTIARLENTAQLKTDVETLETDVERLRAEEDAYQGTRLREVKGEGDRQYLTGLFVGGTHVLIALDASASMLDSTIVQVLRRRNMAPERQRAAPKWQRARRTVEWLAAQLPLDSNYQIALFNTETTFLLPEGRWHPADDPDPLGEALDRLARTLPEGGTRLIALVDAIKAMRPPPDNVFLITDGLPTLGADPPRRATVSGRARVRLFDAAARQFPRDVPVNVVLFPLEGDPLASAAYWTLTVRQQGTFMSPSGDWP